MGFEIKFNWVLQIEPPLDMIMDEWYPFIKPGNRAFPLDTPIDLISPEREVIAKIRIIEYSNSLDGTRGMFQVIKLYVGDERSILTRYWRENE